MPGEDEAYRLATNIIGYLYSGRKQVPAEKWKHPIVYHAAKHVGFYELNHSPEAKSKPAFTREYKQLIKKWLSGERYFIPEPVEKKLSPPATVTQQELLRAREDLRKFLGREPIWNPCKAEQG